MDSRAAVVAVHSLSATAIAGARIQFVYEISGANGWPCQPESAASLPAMDFLQTCLQLHLTTDESAVYNVQHIIFTLSPHHLESAHAPKWMNRVNALIRARDAGARWAGLVLALQTSRLSRTLLLNSAQTWMTAVLPILLVSRS